MSFFKRQGEKHVDADIRCVQGRGIEVKLEKYTRLMVSERGISYWYPEYQEFLLGKLHPFLPRMEYDPENDTVTASMVAGGKEVLGSSRCIKNIADIPQAAHRELVGKIRELEQEVSRTGADPDIKRVVENFSLPDPSYSPELYLVYGKDKLAVLWGLEKRDAGPPITIFDWSKKYPPPPPPSPTPRKWLRRILLAILCMVLVGGGTWLCREYGEKVYNYIKDVIERWTGTDSPPLPVDVERVKQSLYEVQSIRNGEVIGTSEAFAVNLDGTMIVGADALKEYGTPGVSYRVISPNGTSYTIGDVHVNNDEWLAVFRANVDKRIPYLEPRDGEEPKLGEEVYVYDLRKKDTDSFLKPSKINTVDETSDGVTHFSHDAGLDSDLSGCPVLDSQGRVLGVVSGEGTPQRDTAVWVDDLEKLPPVTYRDVEEAEEAANNAEDGPAAEAKREAARSQAAADRAEEKSRRFPSRENIQNAKDAQSHANRARVAAAHFDPFGAMVEIYSARDEVKKLLDDVKEAARSGDTQRANEISREASQAARDAENDARGIARYAGHHPGRIDEVRANEARRIADEIRNIADEVRKTAQREIIVEVDGMRFAVEPIPDRQSEPGKIWVNVRVDASDVEEGTINAVRLDGRNSAAIQINADGEEVPFNVKLKGWDYPKAGSLRLHVSGH